MLPSKPGDRRGLARESRCGRRTRRSSISRVLLSSACTFCAAAAASAPPDGRRLASAPISLLKPKVPAAELGARALPELCTNSHWMHKEARQTPALGKHIATLLGM